MIHLWSNNMWQCRSLLSLSFFCPSFRPSFLATNYVQAHDVDDVLPEQTALEAGCQSLLDTYFSSHFKWPCKLFRHSQTRMCLLKKFQRRVIGMHLPLYKIIVLLADKVWGTMIHLWSNNMCQCRSLLSLFFFCPSFRPSFLATNYVQAHDVDDVLPEQTALEAGCQSLLDTYFSSHFKCPCKLFRHSQTRMCLLKKFQRRVIGMHLPLYKIIVLLADKVWGTMIHLWSNNMCQCRSLLSLFFSVLPSVLPSLQQIMCRRMTWMMCCQSRQPWRLVVKAYWTHIFQVISSGLVSCSGTAKRGCAC